MEIAVVWDEDALSAIKKTHEYIKQFSPGNALKFVNRLVDFGNSLGLFPEKFKLCTKPSLRKRHFHCITFRNHIFIYKRSGNQLRIYKVFHSKQNPRKHRV